MTEQSAYVLVPREPTREMWAAGADAAVGKTILHHDIIVEAVWNAMIAAYTPAPVDDDRLREIRERLALATVASCNCGVKTFQAEYHESACRYRALTEADDLIASLQARVGELEAIAGDCICGASGGWLPIETAPKDGTFVLATVAGFIPSVVKWVVIDGVGKWSDDPEMFVAEEHFLEYWNCTRYAPTHWMPLPMSPSALEDK